jgi:LysR family transcriptional regulator, glycine cleavage system transcriptional activator
MQNKLPNLNLLLTFEVAGQLLSFKQAAEVLHVTPSAVSQQIQQLEESLGQALFLRRNRALQLTEEGERFLTAIHPHLNGLRRATSALRPHQGARLRVSVMPPVANRVLLPKLADFHRAHEEVELFVETSLSNANLLAQDIDIAIRYGRPPWPGLSHEKLCDVMIQMIAPVGFSEQYGLPENLSAMAELPLIDMVGRPGIWQRWFDQLNLPAPDTTAYKVDDYPAAIQAAETLGAALAIYPVEKPLVASGRVEALFPPVGPLDEAIYAVYPQNRDLPAGGRAFIDWIKSLLSELDAS